MVKRRISAPPSRPIHTLDHVGIRTLIAEYVTIFALEQELSPEWKVFEEHLAKCSLCQHDTLILRQHMKDIYSGQIPTLSTAPQPNLAFLRRRHPRPRSRTLQGRTIIATAEESTVRRFQFTAALLPLMQAPVTMRGEELRLRYAYETILDGDVALTIEVFYQSDDATTCVVRCCVEMSDRNPFDQAGSKIILLANGQEFTNTTGKDGSVSFVNVPLENIENWQLIITPPSKNAEAG
jgi:hypothetical protein